MRAQESHLPFEENRNRVARALQYVDWSDKTIELMIVAFLDPQRTSLSESTQRGEIVAAIRCDTSVLESMADDVELPIRFCSRGFEIIFGQRHVQDSSGFRPTIHGCEELSMIYHWPIVNRAAAFLRSIEDARRP